MEKSVLTELKSLRLAVATLAGTADLPDEKQLDMAALGKVAKEFKQLSSVRKAWVEEHQLNTIFKGLHYGSGKFLREDLGFTQYFKHGRAHFYKRKALLALARELKERKVSLARYIEYKEDRAKFEGKTKTAIGKKKLAMYMLPEDMRSIETSATPPPDKILVTHELKCLNMEFTAYEDYIDAYNGYAMLKFDYHFKHFRDAAFRASCKKWIEQYNYAHQALRLLEDSARVKA